MLNFRLMAHWQNWATILLMVLIAVFAFNCAAKMVTFNSGAKDTE